MRWFFGRTKIQSHVFVLLRVLPVRGFVFLDSGDRPNPGEGWNIQRIPWLWAARLDSEAPAVSAAAQGGGDRGGGHRDGEGRAALYYCVTRLGGAVPGCGEAAGGAGWKEEDGAAGAGARARRIGDAGKEARLGWSGPRRRVEPAQE